MIYTLTSNSRYRLDPNSQSGCVEVETNVFSSPTVEPGFLGRPTCVLTIILTAVCLYSHLGFGQTRDQVLHPRQTLNLKLYMHFVYISIVVLFFNQEKRRRRCRSTGAVKSVPWMEALLSEMRCVILLLLLFGVIRRYLKLLTASP